MDKRSKIEMVDAAIELVTGNEKAVDVLRNARRAVVNHYGVGHTLHNAALIFDADVAAVIRAVAEDLAV